MIYLEMRPEQIRDAVARGVPAVLAAGAVEYHAEHLPVGADTLIAESILRRVERLCECVVFPSLPFSPTMKWAGGPQDGEFDFDSDAVGAYARELLRGIAAVGFRRIYIIQHHAGENGLPALTLRRAGVQVLRDAAETFGPGWGRRPMETLPNPDIFSLVRVANIDSFIDYASGKQPCPIGHAGRGETQLMMPDHAARIRMEALRDYDGCHGVWPEWLLDVYLADPGEGERWIERCAAGWARELSGAQSVSNPANSATEEQP